MMAFDTSIISLVIDDSRSSMTYPKTRDPVERPGDRVRYLLSSLARDKKAILLPAPVVSELLIYSEEKAMELFRHLHSKNIFRIAAFDTRAALEMARSAREKIKRDGSISGFHFEENISRNKIKVDYQIVAIALTQGAKAIYSQDRHLNNHSKRCGLEVRTITDIDLPPSDI